MSDGLKAIMQKHAEELEVEQAAHRDALALCEVYEQRIVGLYETIAGLRTECETLLLERDEAERKLDAARAGRYVPLPDGTYTMQGWGDTYTLNVCFDGAELEAWSNAAEDKYKDSSPKHVEEIGVGDYRLCRLQPASNNGAQDG